MKKIKDPWKHGNECNDPPYREAYAVKRCAFLTKGFVLTRTFNPSFYGGMDQWNYKQIVLRNIK